MSSSCFRTQRLGDSSKLYLSCVSSQEKTAIVFMGRDFEHLKFKDSSSRGEYEMPYLYYRFSNVGFNKYTFRKCRNICGQMQPSETKSACSALLKQHFLSSTHRSPLTKRVEYQIEKATTLLIQQPNICIWVFSAMPTECFQCLRKVMGIKQLPTKLSRTTLSLRSMQMSIAECFGPQFSCFNMRNVPVDICNYEERSMMPSQLRTGLKQASTFDLNMEPDPGIDLEYLSTLVQQCSPSSTSDSNEIPLPDFGALTTVIHFDIGKGMELNFFRCVTCLVVHEEVLLVSVEQAHIWVTKEEREVIGFLNATKSVPIPRSSSRGRSFNLTISSYYNLSQLTMW